MSASWSCVYLRNTFLILCLALVCQFKFAGKSPKAGSRQTSLSWRKPQHAVSNTPKRFHSPHEIWLRYDLWVELQLTGGILCFLWILILHWQILTVQFSLHNSEPIILSQYFQYPCKPLTSACTLISRMPIVTHWQTNPIPLYWKLHRSERSWKCKDTSGNKMHCSWLKQAHSNLPPISLKRAPIPLCVETKKRKNRLDIPFVRGDCLGRYLFRDFSLSRTRDHPLRPFGCL